MAHIVIWISVNHRLKVVVMKKIGLCEVVGCDV